MANIFRNAEAASAAMALVHDILIAGGLRSDNQKGTTIKPDFDMRTAAPVICNELVNRDFADIDYAFNQLSGSTFNASFDPASPNIKRITPTLAAKAIVFFAQKLGLYWDDTNRGKYEIDAFKGTILGDIVFKYGQNLSAIKGQATTPSTRAPRAPRTPNAGGATAAQGSYKQSGPQSGNVRDLQGQPGNKVYANTNVSFKIVGDSSTARGGANAFIKPLSRSRGSIANGTNRVLVGSGRGFGDCICFFDDLNDANDFLAKLATSGNLPSNVTNLRVVKVDSDPNGYFLIGTEFGTIAARAVALNEALKESAKQAEMETTEWDSVLENLDHDEKLDFFDKLLGD